MKLLALLLVLVLNGPVPSVAPLIAFSHGPVCTTFSINEAKKYWVTAGHCIRSDNYYSILGKPANPVDVNEADDLAVLKGGIGAPAIPLSLTEPKELENVVTAGFPAKATSPVILTGYVILMDIMLPIDNGPFRDRGLANFMVFAMPVMFGHSGGPVLHEGKLVSVIQGRFQRHPYSTGARWKQLVKYLIPYTK